MTYLLLCVQYWSPDDGQRNCLKHVGSYSKNKFEKLVHLVGFIIRILNFLLCCPLGVRIFGQIVQWNWNMPCHSGTGTCPVIRGWILLCNICSNFVLFTILFFKFCCMLTETIPVFLSFVLCCTMSSQVTCTVTYLLWHFPPFLAHWSSNRM